MVRGHLATKWLSVMIKKSQVNSTTGSFYSETTSNTFDDPKGFVSSDDTEIVDGDFREIDETKEK